MTVIDSRCNCKECEELSYLLWHKVPFFGSPSKKVQKRIKELLNGSCETGEE